MRTLSLGLIKFLILTLIVSCSGSNGPVIPNVGVSARIVIDSTTARPGQSVPLYLRLLPVIGTRPIDSIQSFDFRISYVDSVLTFLDAGLAEADSAWEYFTYRHYPKGQDDKLGTIRLLGIRDLNNGDNHPTGQPLPVGPLFRMQFLISSDLSMVGLEPEITFWSSDCTDNVLVDAASSEHLHMAQRILSNTALSQMADTLECPRRYSLTPDLELISGAVRIIAQPDDPSGPGITVSVSNAAGLDGDTVEAHLRINYGIVLPYVPTGLGGMQFSILYDTAAMHVLDVVRGDQLEGWEHFLWRDRPTNGWAGFHSHLTILSILEANNGVPATGKTRPMGDLAIVRLVLNRDLSAADACEALTFYSVEPDDNMLADLHWTVGYLPFPEQSGIEFPLSYDTLDCGPVDSCEMIVKYLKSGCPE